MAAKYTMPTLPTSKLSVHPIAGSHKTLSNEGTPSIQTELIIFIKVGFPKVCQTTEIPSFSSVSSSALLLFVLQFSSAVVIAFEKGEEEALAMMME